MRFFDLSLNILKLVSVIRTDHPTMSLRSMFYKINPSGMGRDAFERMCKENGYESKRRSIRARTTDSSGVIRFANVLASTTLRCPYQAWSSDITYYELNERFYYITFIMDCFTRVIVGYSISDNLRTLNTSLPALKAAIKKREHMIKPGLIFHSDGGGQYYSKEFLECTQGMKMINSMCEYAYENGKAERLNGVIKNNYLRYFKIKTYAQLIKNVDRAVELYNCDKPHKALKYNTPADFEKEWFILHEKNSKSNLKIR